MEDSTNTNNAVSCKVVLLGESGNELQIIN